MLANEYLEIVKRTNRNTNEKKDPNEEREKLTRRFVKKKIQGRSNPCILLPSMQSNFPLHHRRRFSILRSSHTGISKYDSEKHLHCNVPLLPFPPYPLTYPLLLLLHRTFSNPTPTATSSSKTAHSLSKKNLPMERMLFRDVIVVRGGFIGDIRRKNVV